MFDEFDIIGLIIKELDKSDKLIHHKIKQYMMDNWYTCDDIIHNSPKFKESTIIVSHILKNISCDLTKEISNIIS